MKRVCIILFAFFASSWLLSCGKTKDSPSTSKGFKDYNVSIERVDEITMCEVTFTKEPPNSDVAAKIVRQAVEELIDQNGDQEILAIAFNASGDALPETHYGGPLNYKPSDGQILTMRERDGEQITEENKGSYFVQVEERRTASGITPVKIWIDMSIVFSSSPTGEVIKETVLQEMEALKARKLDINAFIFKGDLNNKVTWKQIQAANGKYMGVNYDSRIGEIIPNWNWD